MARSGARGHAGARTRAPAGGSVPFRPAEARLLSVLASRAALALENHLYQKELIATERMAALGTMAGMLAHDFRDPMTVIRGYAETLLDAGVRPGGGARRRPSSSCSMVDRLDRMTAETLDFARAGGRVVRRSRRPARASWASSPTSSSASCRALDRARPRACPRRRRARSTRTSCAAPSATSPPTRGTRWAAAAGSTSPRACLAAPPTAAPERLAARGRGRGAGRAAGDPRHASSSPSSPRGKKGGTGLGPGRGAPLRRGPRRNGRAGHRARRRGGPTGARFRLLVPLVRRGAGRGRRRRRAKMEAVSLPIPGRE